MLNSRTQGMQNLGINLNLETWDAGNAHTRQCDKEQSKTEDLNTHMRCIKKLLQTGEWNHKLLQLIPLMFDCMRKKLSSLLKVRLKWVL